MITIPAIEKHEEITTTEKLCLKLGHWTLNPSDIHQYQKNNIWTVDNFLSPDECQQLITHSEKMGFADGENGTYSIDDYRSNKRRVWDDKDFAAQIWERVKQCVPKNAQRLKGQEITGTGYYGYGCYEHLRFYRYDQLETFAKHYDGARIGKKGQRSFLTCIVYLNDVREGGRTNFFAEDHSTILHSVQPKQGTCLFFVHAYLNLHEGEMIPRGSEERKYVFRTDVMYSKDVNMQAKK
jgi:hypothetical protein